MISRPAIGLASLTLLAACSTTPAGGPIMEGFAAPESAQCASATLAVDTDFPAGALQSCSIDEAGLVSITLAPENEPPINCSPWYAFRLHSAGESEAQVRLSYTACGHRYWPKISTDGTNWEFLDPARVEVREFAGSDIALLTIPTNGAPIFVSAQEIFVPATYDAWLDEVESTGKVRRSLLGQSAEGRRIEAIALGNPAAREQVVLVGRQHPPEVTGALAMLPFVETLLGDDGLAVRFRERFQVTAIPLLNPDGVVHGYWRHNSGGVDLNRDWGPFTQPETQLMRDLLAGIAANPARDLRLMLDFHSTNRDVFYTIPDELATEPELFTRDWLARYQERMPGYDVNRDARHTVGRPISKAYAFDTYGVPGVTFEIGDETDRSLIRRIGREAAIAMMETLLATPQE